MEPAVLYLEPRNDHAAALRFFSRRSWLRRIARLGRGEPKTLSPKLPYVELVWMPWYLVSFTMTSRRGTGITDVAVDAYLGAFAIFQMHPHLREGVIDGDVFEPKMDPEEAAAIGRKRLLESVMFRRGQRNKPVPGEAENVRLIHYPFYVYYYERRPGKIDIKVFDAVRGENPGSKTKNSILTAMVAQRREAT